MSASRMNVLILDDNAHMRALLRTILLGFNVRNVEEASDAAEAFQLLRDRSVDIAFVDLRLQGLDGLEFCRLVRTATDSPNPYLPIIMVTAYSERSHVVDAINAGVDEFLVKPVRAMDLGQRINAIIDRRRPFVRSADFFGPDRRRKNDPRYKGALRRHSDSLSEKI